ncbi:MAG: hypothetical protein ACSLE1_16845 [Sphingobium sp.]
MEVQGLATRLVVHHPMRSANRPAIAVSPSVSAAQSTRVHLDIVRKQVFGAALDVAVDDMAYVARLILRLLASLPAPARS